MRPKPIVIILAAGKGTRMKSALPKVLHPVCGRPMIDHVLRAAEALAPARIAVVVAPDQPALQARLEGAGCLVCIQPEARGTGDAVRVALESLAREGASLDDPVIIAYGDMPLVQPEALADTLAALPGDGGLAVLGFELSGDHAYGRLIRDPSGGLARIVEAADATPEEKAVTLCNSGLMAASGGALLARLLARLEPQNARNELYLTDAVALAREEGLASGLGVAPHESLMGVNARTDLARAEAAMQARLREGALAGGASLIDPATVYLSADTRIGQDVVIGPHVVIGPDVTIADGVEIRPYCHIEGAQIDAGAIIGPFARLRPGARIGAGAHIGNFVEIKAAEIEPGAKINHLSYVGDARVGSGSNLGAGTITCNYDGFAKHRTEIGAGVFVGSNTAFIAPVTIGDGAVIGAGSVIDRDVAPDALSVVRAGRKDRPEGAKAYRARKSVAPSGHGD